MVNRVIATESAEQLIARLIVKYGPVMFHQSGSCCDGCALMCFLRAEFMVGAADILLGEVGGSPFYISPAQYECWKHTQLILDVVKGRGCMFSLESPEGYGFHTCSRSFSDDEQAELPSPL